mmetsp:Transcript_43254/g.85671  ORF Transcript_43254/g.85671 Transcript_43254/m.85671 type:complete len:265 (-) Transcript_43254:547-1341(-)
MSASSVSSAQLTMSRRSAAAGHFGFEQRTNGLTFRIRGEYLTAWPKKACRFAYFPPRSSKFQARGDLMFRCTCTVPSFPSPTKIGMRRFGSHAAVPKPTAQETTQPGSIMMVARAPTTKTLQLYETGKKATVENLAEGEGVVELEALLVVAGISTTGMVGTIGQKMSGPRSGEEGSGARSSGRPRKIGQLRRQLAGTIGPGRTHLGRSGQMTGQRKNNLQDLEGLPGGGGLCCSRPHKSHKRLAWRQVAVGTGEVTGCAVRLTV